MSATVLTSKPPAIEMRNVFVSSMKNNDVTVVRAQASAITQFVGGAGRDFISVLAPTEGNFAMPALNLVGFDPAPLNAWEPGRDFVVLSAAFGTTTPTTLTAAAGLNRFVEITAVRVSQRLTLVPSRHCVVLCQHG